MPDFIRKCFMNNNPATNSLPYHTRLEKAKTPQLQPGLFANKEP
jgi:hypothetical protein